MRVQVPDEDLEKPAGPDFGRSEMDDVVRRDQLRNWLRYAAESMADRLREQGFRVSIEVSESPIDLMLFVKVSWKHTLEAYQAEA